MLRRCVFGGLMLVVAASVLFAKPGIVKTRDGNTYQGDVTSDEMAYYVTNASGIQMRLDKRNVESVQDVASPHDQFVDRLGKLAKDDVDGRIKLARWAYERRLYNDARDSLDSALVIDANNREATEMLGIVQRQMRLESGAKPGGGAGAPPAETNPGNGARPPAPATAPVAGRDEPKKFLSPTDVQRVRQLEWGRNDTGIRVRLKGDVKNRYIKFRALDQREFNAMNAVDQAWDILHDGTDEMAKDVELLSDPAAIAEFRKSQVMGKVLSGCATASCHGNAGAGGFQLFDGPSNDAVVYTNFYILQKYTKEIGGQTYSMIDRAAPQNSLLIQFGLPADLSEIDHPATGSYRGIFRNKNDVTYKALEAWMGKTLAVVVPDYGIEYTPPTPTTKPSTTAPAR
jgi:hypothetical protein